MCACILINSKPCGVSHGESKLASAHRRDGVAVHSQRHFHGSGAEQVLCAYLGVEDAHLLVARRHKARIIKSIGLKKNWRPVIGDHAVGDEGGVATPPTSQLGAHYGWPPRQIM